MGAARFRYALQPLALQRQWALDDLQRELGACNAALAPCQAACDEVARQLAQAGHDWRLLADGQQPMSVDRLALVARYLAERRAHWQQLERERAQLEQERDAAIARVVAARRALDAVHEHRDQMRARFMAARLSGQFKDADDQWSVLQARGSGHGV